jgi:uncharacterized protein (TIGR02147 family)
MISVRFFVRFPPLCIILFTMARTFQSTVEPASVFLYSDYRKFLRDSFEGKKADGSTLSYRYICSRTGIKSTGHLSLILQGKANISISLAKRLAEFLKLKKRDKEYFEDLVLFNQAKLHKDKREYFVKMMGFKESAVRLVNEDQYEYYDKWYHCVVRALLDIVPVKDNFGDLAQAIDPPISEKEARNSVELMMRLRLVKKNDLGYFLPSDAVIDSGPAIGSLAVTNYAGNMIDLGKQALDRIPQEERVFSWATLGISEEGYETVLQELREFRRRVYAIAEADKAQRVYQFNFQVFPVSKKNKPKENG